MAIVCQCKGSWSLFKIKNLAEVKVALKSAPLEVKDLEKAIKQQDKLVVVILVRDLQRYRH